MTKLGLLATAAVLMAFSPLAMAQSNTSSIPGNGILVAQAQSATSQEQVAEAPDEDYEAPDTMPTYQKNDGTDPEE